MSAAAVAASGIASCATATRTGVIVRRPSHVATAAIGSAGAQVSHMSRPWGAYTIGIDSVGGPRTSRSPSAAAANHHGASHHRRTPHVDSASPATSTKIAAAPGPSASAGIA